MVLHPEEQAAEDLQGSPGHVEHRVRGGERRQLDLLGQQPPRHQQAGHADQGEEAQPAPAAEAARPTSGSAAVGAAAGDRDLVEEEGDEEDQGAGGDHHLLG